MNNPWNFFADSFLAIWNAGLEEGGTAAISIGSCDESIHIPHPGEGGTPLFGIYGYVPYNMPYVYVHRC